MASIDQKAYLQKYLSGSSGDKKKKKKKVIKGKGFKIIDDDLDLTKLRPFDGDELDMLDQSEDGPQVAGIIDERPEEVKKLEQFKTSSKWRVVTQDDGFNSKLQIEEIKKDIKVTQKENEIEFGKMYSDSEDEKQNDSDLSPPKIKPDDKVNNRDNKGKRRSNSGSDVSPPRKGRETTNKSKKHYDSNLSPTRIKPDDKARNRDNKRKNQSKSDSDVSPPRKGRETTSRSKIHYDSDLSPPRIKPDDKVRNIDSKRKKQSNSDSDVSPPRRGRESTNKNQKQYDSDLSPPRKSGNENVTDRSRKKSPPRQSGSSNVRAGRNRKQSRWGDSDEVEQQMYQSASEKNNHKERRKKPQRERESDDSDLSPPRKNKRKSESPSRKDRSRKVYENEKNYKRSNDSPPPTNKKMEKTLDGKLAGLQNARQLREENEAFRKRENDVYSKMTDEVSGRNAGVVSRKANKRETSEERRMQSEKAERQKILDEKYKKWSKGLKQIEGQEARMQEFMHEASKPLARLKNDRDLEYSLKQIERAGDPMLQYIRDKKRERGELMPEKPLYKGNFPPNRFNIRPGYRWDGVDRSNGYEKKYFDQQSKRKAQEEEIYKWSTEDL